MPSESLILSNVMDKTRQQTGNYLDLLYNTDMHQVFEVNGKQLNSAFWIMAHLAVTENFLLLRSTGGESVKIPWARQYGLGGVHPAREDSPPQDEVKSVFADVHQRAIKHISQLDDSILDTESPTRFDIWGDTSVRFMILHAIRHEGSHAGQLGWLCKLNGIKTL